MRSTCSLYIDAGYLLASAATRVSGTSLRSGIHVEYGKLLAEIVRQAEDVSGMPLLRVHWYDSAKDGIPDAQQQRIGELPKVKLRLGRFGVDGQQKGVDLRIGLDLVAHARNGASDAFFLVTGDDDLTEAVEDAQVHGVQVSVLAVPNADGRPHGVSRHLLRAADDLILVDPDTLDDVVLKVELNRDTESSPPAQPPAPAPVIPSPSDLAQRSPATPPRPAAPTPAAAAAASTTPSSVLAYTASTGREPQFRGGHASYDGEYAEHIDRVISRVLNSFTSSANPDQTRDLLGSRPSIPRDIDRALLVDLSDAINVYDLNDAVRHALRSRFWELADESLVSSA